MKRFTQATAIGGLLGACSYLTFHLGAWALDRAYRIYDNAKRKSNP